MIISKLNRFADKHGKAVIIIIALMIVVPFVFLWGPNSLFDRSGDRRLTHAGELYGEKIPVEDILRQIRFAQLEMMQTRQRPLDLNDDATAEFLLGQAVKRMQALHEAEKRGLDLVSEEQIDEVVRRSFSSPDAGFDRERYVFFRDVVLRSLGLGETDFREFIRQDIVLSRVYGEVLADVFVTPLEVDEQLRVTNQKFKVAYKAFEQGDYSKSAEAELAPNDAVEEALAKLNAANPEEAFPVERQAAVDEVLAARARDFFNEKIEPLRPWIDGSMSLDGLVEQYKAAFDSDTPSVEKPTPIPPEEFETRLNKLIRPLYKNPTKRLVVAKVPVKDFTQKVGEIEVKSLRAKYQENIQKYEERVRARHILIRVPEGAGVEAEQAAKAKIEELRSQLLEGADFAELAKQHSEDPGSAVRGGELGSFGRGRMVKPFEDAAFALKEGEISDVVKSDFGYHLIKVDKVFPGKTFEDVQFDLVAELTKERARKFAWDAAEDLSYQVFEQSDRWQKDSFQVLAQMAADKGYTVKTTDFFRPDGDYPELFGDSRAAVRKAYSVTENQPLSEAIEGENAYFVAALVEVRPGSLSEFNLDSMAFCRNIIVQDKAEELARAAASTEKAEILEQLPESDVVEFLELTYGFEAPEPFTRMNPPTRDQVGWTVLGQLAEQSEGSLSDPIDILGGAVLVYVAERLPVDLASLPEDDREVARQQVRQRKVQAAMQVFHDQLDEESKPNLIEGLAGMLAR
jgi:parvulin-like peptidyl-prolyl isomerase